MTRQFREHASFDAGISMRKAGWLCGLAVAAVLSSQAQAAPVGNTVDAATTVTGSGPGGNRVINKGSPIFSDDRLKADRTGNAQIILVDNTKIVVGPGAQVDIVDYVYETDKTFSKITIKATKGAIRFISGKSKASAYKVVTPSGTIGIRG
jgi:hypothetical protein